MEKGNGELWGVYSRGAFEFEIGAGNPYVGEERKQPHAQSFKGREEIVMGKGAGQLTWVSLYQTHMFRQQFSGCP